MGTLQRSISQRQPQRFILRTLSASNFNNRFIQPDALPQRSVHRKHSLKDLPVKCTIRLHQLEDKGNINRPVTTDLATTGRRSRSQDRCMTSPVTVPRIVEKRLASILKKSASSAYQTRRRCKSVNFAVHVLVFLFDDSGEIETSVREEQLQSEPSRKTRIIPVRLKRFKTDYPLQNCIQSPDCCPDDVKMNTTASSTARSETPSSTSSMTSSYKQITLTDNESKISSDNRHYQEQSLTMSLRDTTDSEVEFTFSQNEKHQLLLRFFVVLERDIKAADVVVKANVNGNRVRVIADKPTFGRVFNEVFFLPMRVDPHLVTAKLEFGGKLCIEAPINTLVS